MSATERRASAPPATVRAKARSRLFQKLRGPPPPQTRSRTSSTGMKTPEEPQTTRREGEELEAAGEARHLPQRGRDRLAAEGDELGEQEAEHLGGPAARGEPLRGRDQDEEQREEAEEDVEGDGAHEDRHLAREEQPRRAAAGARRGPGPPARPRLPRATALAVRVSSIAALPRSLPSPRGAGF